MATKRVGRPLKYDWSDKRDICYKLFVEENKSVKDISKYFVDNLRIDPSEIPNARDFSRQFQRWEFPSKRERIPAEEEARLVERIKQLWQANYIQQQMLDALNNEGWQIEAQVLARLRRKHGIVLRVAAGFDSKRMGPGTGKKRKRTASEDDAIRGPIHDAAAAAADVQQPGLPDAGVHALMDTEDGAMNVEPETADLPPEGAARRAQRLLEIQANSDTQFNSRKRRRRIRGYAHLPPDAPGLPPRYKSETSLDECKAYLSLTNDAYREIRANFEKLCTEMGITKKKLCKNGEWTSAKTRLIRESVHLSASLNPIHGDIAERENALEVICSDVTKRMRTMKKRIFVKEANVILGLNPDDSKEFRRQFYEILKADHFETMLLCGKEHWEELRQQWLDSSELAQRLYAQGLDDEKKRCVDVLLRDAMKRHNDNNVDKIPHLSQADGWDGPGPGPAKRSKDVQDEHAPLRVSSLATSISTSTLPALPVTTPAGTVSNPNIDPALFAALSSDLSSHLAVDSAAKSRLQPANTIASRTISMMDLPGFSNAAPTYGPVDTAILGVNPAGSKSYPAYFRLSPMSRILSNHPNMWLATLGSPTLDALQAAATVRSRNTRPVKISGVIKGLEGHEDHYQIDSSDELVAYFDTVEELLAGKATFLVVLEDVSIEK